MFAQPTINILPYHDFSLLGNRSIVTVIVIVIVIKALQCMAGYNYSRKVNSINLIMH